MSRSNQLAGLITATPTSTLDTINEINASLNNDANLSTTLTNSINAKAPIASPTFTGTVSGVTKTHVGLGNVDNESKATMFTSPTLTGTPTVSSSSASYSPTLDINNSNAGAYGGILKFTAKAGSTTYTPAQVRAYGGSGASDGRLAIETAGTERFRIDHNGKVGIGTDNPQANILTGITTGGNSSNIYLGATGTGNAELVLDASNGDFSGSDYYMLRQLNSLDVEHWLGTSGDYIFKTAAGTERMRIHSSGEVTIPYQPAFFAIKNGSYTEAQGAHIVTGWTENFDRGSDFDATGNGRFTAPVAGVYQFNYNAMAGQTSGDVQYRIYKNGTVWAGSNSMAQGGGPWRQTCVTAVINMSANDYVTFIAYSSQTTSTEQLYNGTYSTVSGCLIG